jgi:DNA modification methylase
MTTKSCLSTNKPKHHHKTQCEPAAVFSTGLGNVICADSLQYMADAVDIASVDLIMTSPPFPLLRQKEYGNPAADDYLDWFRPFAQEFRRVLKPNGSLVLDMAGAWNPGLPTRNLINYEVVRMLVQKFGFHLAQEISWWNPSGLPAPARWVTVKRVRLKAAVNTVWWLSPTPWPKASNRRVQQPYSPGMEQLLAKGCAPAARPSGHAITTNFCHNNGGAIPPNLISLSHTHSNTPYARYCRQHGLRMHPARFPVELPEFFIRLLTDRNDLVIDPFAGSCTTGEAAEGLGRRWLCIEQRRDYLLGALGRFQPKRRNRSTGAIYYQAYKPGSAGHGPEVDRLPEHGGAK